MKIFRKNFNLKGNDNVKNIGKTKKLLSFVLVVVLLLGVAPFGKTEVKAASFNDINTSEVFLKQPKGSVTCTLYAATMMMRRTAIAAGNSNWRSITPSNVASVAWYSGGLYYNFSYAGISVGHAYVNQNDIKGSYISLLKTYPQGVVAYNRGQPHAILLTDYDASTDTFYCADSDPYYASGRIPLSQSSITGSNQYDKLNRMTDYWYVKSPSVSIQDSIFSNPQNIGDDFYAAIIKNDGWATLAPVNGNVQIVKGTGDASEFWHFVRQSDNSYVIYNCKSGKVLDVQRAATNDGTQIIEFDYWSNQNQQWFIYGRWSGEYILKPKHCDKVLDVFSNDSYAGTKVQLWSYNQSNAQKFAIYKFDKVGSTSIKVSTGNSETETTFSWSKAANATLYNLRIMTGTPGNLNFYKNIWSLKDTSYSLILPAGYYEVWVDACTVYHYTSSNLIKFNIEKGIHTHSYTSKITTAATCTEDGVKTFTCSCGDKYTEEIPALGHIDENNDNRCDRCGVNTGASDTPDTPSENCSHICHKGGFIWAIIRFFCKIFRTNKYCSCGAAHY